ncbi:hypothetical protein LTR08_001871 [Meristemomyces frigidus]|nr:hypothetical protein LTR08_001871 [Meristemomyces frigidus]
MVHFYDSISDDLRDWALQQQVFFVASAPLTGKHINTSPKGLPASTLTVFDSNHVGYIDATGSGIETISHLYENGRATIMFCSFDKSPRIMRWFCTGKVVEVDDPEFERCLARREKRGSLVPEQSYCLMFGKASTAVVKGSGDLNDGLANGDDRAVQTSCGYAVPLVSTTLDPTRIHEGPRAYLEDRNSLGHWAGQQIEKGTLDGYRERMNARSLDDCAGLRVARGARGENLQVEDAMIWLRRMTGQWEAMLLGAVLAVVAMLALRASAAMLDFGPSNSVRHLI